MNKPSRKEIESRRRKLLAITSIDIMEHRFWLHVVGVETIDLGKHVNIFLNTFAKEIK